jgi:HSP20 family protein
MPSVTYMNQSAPFWDFIASLEQQGPRHPHFAEGRNDQTETENERKHEDGPQGPQDLFSPWGWGNQFFGGGMGMPHRGGLPQGDRHQHHEDAAGEQNNETNNEKDTEMNEKDNGEGPSGNSASDNEAHGEGRPRGRSHHGRCGGRRGRCGPGGPRGFGHPGPHHGPPHHGHHGGRRGGWGSWGRVGPFGGMGGDSFGLGDNSSNSHPFDPTNFVAQLWNQFNDTHPSNTITTNPTGTNPTAPTSTEDHTPDADIFDTSSTYTIHVSLPGARKEDVGVNWDAEKSELSIAGVIYRPGSEDFLKTLAMNERKVGAFERKIRLGTRASPAHVDADGITAKLEDGVLRVEVPKLDEGFVEVRKVDIE